jgi:hypothetical protein
VEKIPSAFYNAGVYKSCVHRILFTPFPAMFRSLLLLPAFIVSSYALVSAVDSSSLVPETTYAKALGEGFTKAIIRGYEEACGVGGEVDPNFVATYNNARAAGYTNIDTYWFPCNGSGNNCKSYATQISELGATFSAHNMDIGTIWIDLEKDAAICNNVGLPNSVQFAYINLLHFPRSGTMVPAVTSLKLRI